jgi:signal transduction histidine kinase
LVAGQDDRSEELAALRARVRELETELVVRDGFIVAAAHELRNPISPLVLHVQRLSGVARKASAEGGDGSVSAVWLDDQLEMLNRRLARFMSALNRILDVSRIHTGQIELVAEPDVDLSEVAREVVGGFEREIAASRSELTLDAPSAVIGVWDRMRLEQIVSNLVSNAIRYGAGNPIVVSVRCLERAGQVPSAELVVSDRGIGISEADQQRVFDRFERAHAQNRSGFGVGLWIVRQLTEAMGGQVSLRSTPGEGSSFHVVLPTIGTGA